MEIRTSKLPMHLGLWLAFPLAFNSCTTPETPPQQQQEPIVQQPRTSLWPSESALDTWRQNIIMNFSKAAQTLAEQQCIAVCQKEHTILTAAFKDNFRVHDADGDWEMENTDVSFPWDLLEKAVLEKPVHDLITEKAVIACFGVKDLKFTLGLDIVLIAPDGQGGWNVDQADTANRFYVVEGDTLLRKDTTYWNPLARDYKKNIRVSRKGTKKDFVELKNCDHLGYLMPWQQELFFLGAHNPAANADVVFSNGAYNFKHVDNNDEGVKCDPESSLRQVVIVHIAGYLNNNDHPDDVGKWAHGRGVDLGTPCPPRCRKWLPPTQPTTCASRGRCKVQ